MEFSNNIKNDIRLVVEEYGTPTYLYLPSIVENKLADLNKNCADFFVRYAVKSNPNPNLLKWFKPHINSLDVSSSGELKLALKCGWPASGLAFTGPAKTSTDIEYAISSNIGSIVVEDLSELELIEKISGQMNKKTRILIRLAPSQSERGFAIRLAGRATQFGVEQEQLFKMSEHLKQMPHVWLAGFHIYSGSQCLDGLAMAEHFEMLWGEFKQAINVFGVPIEELVFGAGMGVPYHDNDPQLDLTILSAACQKIQQEIKQALPGVSTFIEIGRFLVAESGYFLTEVIRVKKSKNKNIVICNSGMNHNLAACGHLGGIGHRHYSMMNIFSDYQESKEYKVVGPLCTAIDTLAQRVHLPETNAGDIIVIGCAGAYGPSSSPIHFISHATPNEVAVILSNNKKTLQNWSWLPSALV